MTDQHGWVAITVEFLPSLLTRIIAQGLGILSEGKMETGIRAALDTLFEVCYRRA